MIVLLAKTRLEMFEKKLKDFDFRWQELDWFDIMSKWTALCTCHTKIVLAELFQNIIISNVIPLAEAEFAVSGIGFC